MNGIPSTLREKAEEYISNIRNQGPVISDLVRVNRHSLARSGDWKYLFEVFRVFNEDRFDYIVTPPWSAIQQRLQRLYRSRYSYNKLFQKPDEGDKFFIFPLHVQPEATTLTLAPFCVDQPALIANIAKALPIGYQLYVKEHVMAVGRRSLAEYRRIATTPNVKLIHPDSNVRALIKRSAGVCTIVGTMGLEALMFNKPTITFGRPFYDASGLTHPVSDFRDLPPRFFAEFSITTSQITNA